MIYSVVVHIAGNNGLKVEEEPNITTKKRTRTPAIPCLVATIGLAKVQDTPAPVCGAVVYIAVADFSGLQPRNSRITDTDVRRLLRTPVQK